jgi:hypothetical protein
MLRDRAPSYRHEHRGGKQEISSLHSIPPSYRFLRVYLITVGGAANLKLTSPVRPTLPWWVSFNHFSEAEQGERNR